MQSKSLLSCLCYFSVFFAPLIFPVIVYFVADDAETKMHARKSLLSHLLALITVAIASISFIFVLGAAVSIGTELFLLTVAGFFLFGLVNLMIIVWNIVQGVKLLKTV
ncbi:hypothetical protein GJU40_09355 [Bacillus lacus]|uniref:DUF4870 domain-containing protein n=1 Tax=Metabacillus lacus TaxID=1983721 RepID=A0A7X2IZ71_9BACI|nr:DUF4870 domain-containing protein [Metabacillus lacus]MRX72356.1 hypothetical protein [Metabacillus lacus]